jgi:hypothetical protein
VETAEGREQASKQVSFNQRKILATRKMTKIVPQMNGSLKQGPEPGAVLVDVRIIFLHVGKYSFLEGISMKQSRSRIG